MRFIKCPGSLKSIYVYKKDKKVKSLFHAQTTKPISAKFCTDLGEGS